MGACIAEGSRAIANAFSIAGALDIFDRIEILKQSIADAARDSTIEDLSDEIRKLTLGKLLTNHGIALPSNNQTIQDLAAVTLGDIADKVANGISAVADHRISDLDDSATELAGTAFGEISAVMSNHSFPSPAAIYCCDSSYYLFVDAVACHHIASDGVRASSSRLPALDCFATKSHHNNQ